MMPLQQKTQEVFREHQKTIFILFICAAAMLLIQFLPVRLRPESVEEVRNWVMHCGRSGPLVFIVLYAARPFLLFPSIFLNLSAGVLFGPYWGVLYLLLGGLANASVCFWLGRTAGQDQDLLKSVGGRWGARIDDYLAGDAAFVRMLWLRAVPIFPYDPVSIVAGGSSMKYLPYAAATVMGMLPGAIAYNFLADSLAAGSGGIFMSACALLLAFGLPLAWWYFSRAKESF